MRENLTSDELIIEVQDRRNDLEKKKSELSRLEGEISSSLNRLKDEFGLGSLEDAEVQLKEMEKEKKKKEAEARKKLNVLKEKYDF